MDDFNEGDSKRVKGFDAARNNILAARVISEMLKTTLGPKGMDKMLVDRVGNIVITNDGATILKEMEVEHPVAKMLVEVAKTQEAEVGDGTTTAVMIAGKLLENAEKLLNQKVHPSVITRGYRYALEKSKNILKEISVEINSEDELLRVAMTAMTGKGAEHLREKFSEIIVEAVKILSKDGKVDLDNIKIEKKKGGSLEDTALIKGIVLDKEKMNMEMPTLVENARIAIIEEPLEARNIQGESNMTPADYSTLQSFLDQEDLILKSKVEHIKEIGANVLITQNGVDDFVCEILASFGIYTVSRVLKEDIKSISKATGAKIISRVADLAGEDLGFAGFVEEIKEGDSSMTYIRGAKNPKALTILIRGGTDHIIDETERAIRDALGDVAATLFDSKVVAGGGAVEMELSRRLIQFSKTLTGRESLAVLEFASALEFIPITLAENAGLDPIDILTELRALHDMGNKNFGLNLFNENIEDTLNFGIIEPLKVKLLALAYATEAAIMILRIDDVIAAKKIGNSSGMIEGFHEHE